MDQRKNPSRFIVSRAMYDPSQPPLVSETLLKNRRSLEDLAFKRSITVETQRKVNQKKLAIFTMNIDAFHREDELFAEKMLKYKGLNNSFENIAR